MTRVGGSTSLNASAVVTSIPHKEAWGKWQAYLATLIRGSGAIEPECRPSIKETKVFNGTQGQKGFQQERRKPRSSWQPHHQDERLHHSLGLQSRVCGRPGIRIVVVGRDPPRYSSRRVSPGRRRAGGTGPFAGIVKCRRSGECRPQQRRSISRGMRRGCGAPGARAGSPR